MQRKIVNTKYKLHSIPIINKLKSNVLYSIPCSCALALLLAGCLSLIIGNNIYAITCGGGFCSGTTGDQGGSIIPVTSGTSTPPTVSLSLSNANMNQTATPGSTATTNTNVTVNVDNAESYSLNLKVDNTTLKNGDTTINAGGVVIDNTWGYKWDNASSYTAPTTTGANLAVPALSNGSASFTKNLTFGIKFSNDADSGHYKGSGTISLVATPKTASVITLANLTQMQQLAEGYAPEACANTPYLDGQNYSAEYTLTDVRDRNSYTVRKLGDGRCWMTQNLRLSSQAADEDYYWSGGRILNSTTSDVSANWTLPASNTSGFSSDTASNAYVSGNTGYYTWCAATAGTCSSATSGGQNASSSICPKGWKLPTGMVTGANTTNDFYNLFNSLGLKYQGSGLATSGYTNWGTGDLAKVQGSPYNFAYTGYMYNSSTSNLSNAGGRWWSRTAYDSTNAYNLSINSSYVYPGTNGPGRRFGCAVRCVAETPSASGGEATNPR